ncbi:MarR family winged helix-turn-helix transcriptional regulator [Clostridium sp. DJ247]|uniref:MarR family winged helix-turn-helix transcriptional regulator n=1 Tax=Clostridium sp. DJ247 TaxID=2726188 RepID=UPI0016268BD6|nr:MarR family transcriptional regulator [Clostridium sp. DJ247]MBC2581561.1 MarR family transcriptional regulator [Clostridium sp. DJ247]
MCKDKIYEIAKEIEAVSKLMNRKMSSDSRCKRLTFPEILIINQLKEGKVKTLTEISEASGIPNSTASFLIDKLVKEGMVRRERDIVDRRKVLIIMEDKALKLEEETNKYYIDHFRNVFKNASIEDIDIILKGLRTLEKVVVNS